jgi:hypothetical protein
MRKSASLMRSHEVPRKAPSSCAGGERKVRETSRKVASGVQRCCGGEGLRIKWIENWRRCRDRSHWSSTVLVGGAPAVDPTAQNYAIALLAREFTAQHVRVSWLSGTPLPELWLALLRATAGEMLEPGVEDLKKAFDTSGQFLQAD